MNFAEGLIGTALEIFLNWMALMYRIRELVRIDLFPLSS